MGRFRHALFQGSAFKRMYLVYTLIIILAVSMLGFFLSNTLSHLIIDQAMDYNLQQLSSLHTAFSQQVNTMRYLKAKLYEVRTSPDTDLYDALALILRDDRPFVSEREYGRFIDQSYLVHTFFNLVQSSLQVDMSLFQIRGASNNRGNMTIFWPVNNQSMLEYAEEIGRIVEQRPSGSGLFPFISEPGQSYERSFYILYDALPSKQNPAQPLGYLVNGYDASSLGGVLSSFTYPLEGTAYLLNREGEVLYDSSGRQHGEIPAFFAPVIASGESLVTLDGYVHNVIYDRTHQFYVIGRIAQSGLSAKVSEANLSIAIVSLLAAAIAVLLTLLFTRRLRRRVWGITRIMGAAEHGDLAQRAPVSQAGDEFDQIAVRLNHMIGKIDEYIQAEYVSELSRQNALLSQREAELFALQAQVNPHFLYNTLEVIRMQAVHNGDEDTALLIRWLATLFRRRVRSAAVVTLAEELSFCQSLIDILQAKYNGEIAVEIDVPEKVRSFGILKDLIQPPLENAFIHGFASAQEEERVLTLRARQEGQALRVEIHNSGVPIAAETLARIREMLGHDLPGDRLNAEHVGLVNVDQRIRLVYGEGYGLTLDSREGAGTLVTLTIAALSPQELAHRTHTTQ